MFSLRLPFPQVCVCLSARTPTVFLPWICLAWILCPALRFWRQSPLADVWSCYPGVPKSCPQNWTNNKTKQSQISLIITARAVYCPGSGREIIVRGLVAHTAALSRTFTTEHRHEPLRAVIPSVTIYFNYPSNESKPWNLLSKPVLHPKATLLDTIQI